MNEKVAKKVGEAYAFAQVLLDTFSANEAVMGELFGAHAATITATTQTQRDALDAIAGKHGMSEIVLPKAEKTGTKITNMGEMYVGDDWDDVAEVLEWMSFFVGGAIVHWQLIAGAAEKLSDDEFAAVAHEGTAYYTKLMGQLRDYAVIVGEQRASA